VFFLSHNFRLAMSLNAVVSVLGGLWVAPSYALVQSLAGPALRAIAAAIFMMIVNIIGLGLGPWLTGALSDHLAPTFADRSLEISLCLISLTCLIGVVFFLIAARTFDGNQSFDVSADLTLQDGQNSPRKEAGIRVNNAGGDGLFLVNSDAGEIVAFGGPLPFHLFGNDAMGNGYTPGQTLNLRMIYNAANLTVEYQVKEGGVEHTSGPLAFSGILDGSNVGFYGQFSPAASGDFGTATFQNIVALVPEPAGLMGLTVGALALRRRRGLARQGQHLHAVGAVVHRHCAGAASALPAWRRARASR